MIAPPAALTIVRYVTETGDIISGSREPSADPHDRGLLRNAGCSSVRQAIMHFLFAQCLANRRLIYRFPAIKPESCIGRSGGGYVA